MNSKTTDRFWKCYNSLPETIGKLAKEAFKLFMDDPFHPSLHFKRIHASRPIFSVRITKDYRALGIQQDEDLIWFWIGSHSGYNKLLKETKR